MTDILDFLYLDLKRLDSFASQLFSGLPDSATQEVGSESEMTAGAKGGIPAFLQASADTRAVMSASSTVTSRMHHFLVSRVIAELKDGNLFVSDPAIAEDGAFVVLKGQLQISDPLALAATLRMLSPMMQTLMRLQTDQNQAGTPTSGDQRLVRKRQRQQVHEVAAQAQQFLTLADLTEAFGGETVRIRILSGNESLGTAVAERDKFVERLDRLVLRHGHVTGGTWNVLGQVNMTGGTTFFQPEGQTFLDILETTGIAALQQLAAVSSGSDMDWTLTPLAIYREVRGEH